MNISNLELTRKISRNLAVVSFIILLSDEILDALLWLIHSIIEFIEYSFEVFAENILNTNDKQTEIIAFYLIAGVLLYVVYRLFRALPRYYLHSKIILQIEWLKQKKRTCVWWRMLSTAGKIELIALFISSIFFWLLVL